MGRRLQGTKTAGNTFPEHHPILHISVAGLGAGRQLDQRVWLVSKSEAERMDSNPVKNLISISNNSSWGGKKLTWRLQLETRQSRHYQGPKWKSR